MGRINTTNPMDKPSRERYREIMYPETSYTWFVISREPNPGRYEFLGEDRKSWTPDLEEACSFSQDEIDAAHAAYISTYRPDFRVVRSPVTETVRLRLLIPRKIQGGQTPPQ